MQQFGYDLSVFFVKDTPAIDNGRSNQLDIIMPPYFSTFNFTYAFSTVISGFALILKEGESVWLAIR